jgi:alanyl-tRNA synthetase
MTAQEIRAAYIRFFQERGHTLIPRAKLIPYNDPTTLFTGSGMQPLIPYLLGEPHPSGKRLVNSQTCLRAQDIEEVGDNRHTTFFEMLGNWSFGDYFKSEEIPWLFEFLTNVVGLDPAKLYITCYIGDERFQIPKDSDAASLWAKLFEGKNIAAKQVDIGSVIDGYEKGMNGGRIFFYDGSKNWWSRGGSEAATPVNDPGGPDTEVFYDFGTPHDTKLGKECHPNCECGRFMEIANSVFMAYRRTEQGFEPLDKPNVDFGGGLERIAVAASGDPDVFKISLLRPIVTKLEELSHRPYESHTESMRVIADHLRAATFLAVDGVKPSNKEQGYVMRRLIRRAVRYAFELGIEQNFMEVVAPTIIDLYKDDLPEMAAARNEVISTLLKEEKIFRQTLRKGLHEFEKMTRMQFSDLYDAHTTSAENEKQVMKPRLNGEHIFRLYDTYGFPVELTKEEAFKRNFRIADNADEEFDRLMNEQRERSQTASKGVFKGGLGGQSLQHKKYHTATHLMYQALRDVLGDHVVQNGSNITEERLRFDFTHPQKLTAEEIKRVEDIVNEQIKNDLVVSYEEQPTKVALEKGALGQFGDRYGDTVKVYKMVARDTDKPFSFEICGGPHVDHTGQLAEGGKRFKIVKEGSSSSGIRRIKAILE